MPETSRLYRSAVRAAVGLLPMAAAPGKLRRGHAGRRGAVARLAAWARERRDPGRPLIWFHAASVGEGLQARAVIERLRAIRPDCQLAFTHFSPSAEALAARLPVDVADYLPYDTPEDVEAALAALAPGVLVFAKLDVWPELATRAARRGVAVALVAGTVSPLSGRLRWPWRALTRPGYAALSAAAAVSETDAERLTRLGVAADRIQVLGDPRFDSVLDALAGVSPADDLLQFAAAGPALVAGSTWPADEAVVLAAWARLRLAEPGARLVVVPHEPTREHLQGIEARARRLDLPPPARLSSAPADAPFLVADTVGQLARLYGAGVAAFVGGGFGRAGLHSVLEPAGWSLPVAFGPRWQGSRDAGMLLEARAGVALPPAGRGAAVRLAKVWHRWLTNESARREAGGRARQVVEAGRGAADRSAALVSALAGSTRGA